MIATVKRKRSDRSIARHGVARSSALLSPLSLGLLLLVLGAGAGLASAEPAIEVSGDLGAGFDSNPAQSREGPELAFIRHALELSRQWSLAGSELALGVDGWYRDYEADNDSYRTNGTLDWGMATAQGAGRVAFSISGALYRDALVPADERDEAALGWRYRHLLSARDTLGLSAEVRRLAYRNPSFPWEGRPGSVGRQGASKDSRDRRGAVATRRDDDLLGLVLDVTRHWSPSVSTQLSLAHARCDSSVGTQSYDRHGLAVLLRLEPVERWRLELGVGWSLSRYDQASRQREREDRQRSLGLAVRRGLDGRGPGARELYCSLDWLDSDSTIDERAFRQQVTQCGLAWSFN